jgi:hypothetical protein
LNSDTHKRLTHAPIESIEKQKRNQEVGHGHVEPQNSALQNTSGKSKQPGNDSENTKLCAMPPDECEKGKMLISAMMNADDPTDRT